ncbi:hypothetical protein HDV00_007395 [Rhizophlyctis rosea]|nr:hypothetical protein HDV00_007395 [Rhizophlyctis rosea]
MKYRSSTTYVSRSQRRRKRIIIILIASLFLIGGITAAVLLVFVPKTRIVNWGSGGNSGGNSGDPTQTGTATHTPIPGIGGNNTDAGGGGHNGVVGGNNGSPSSGPPSGSSTTGGSGGEGGPGGAAGENPAFPYPCSINDGSTAKVAALDVKLNGAVKSGDNGGVYLGVSPDWSTIDPRAWSAYLGHSASIVDRFFGLDANTILTWDVATECTKGPSRLSIFQWQANLLQQMGGSIMSITITPNLGLDKVTDGVISTIVKACKDANDLGVDVLIRFAHEMNGGWYIWGHTPSLYRSTFARVADAVHNGCPRTAMVWAPNNGVGYPMGGGQYTPPKGDPRFNEMDTNGDGVVDSKDDPYTPYYPGDQYVDWIGVSAYYYGPGPPGGWNNSPGPNVLPDKGLIETIITTQPSSYNLYQMSLDRNKPFMISETSAPYHMDSDPGPGELALKQAWWREVYNADFLRKYPNIRAINWFEYTKKEYGENRDFTLMKSKAVRQAFSQDISNTPGGLWKFGSNLVKAQGSWGGSNLEVLNFTAQAV